MRGLFNTIGSYLFFDTLFIQSDYLLILSLNQGDVIIIFDIAGTLGYFVSPHKGLLFIFFS